MDKQTKEQLILSLLNENFEEGFHMLYVEFYGSMSRLALRYVDNIYVDDLIHDIFIKIWEKKIQISNYNVLKSYLYSSVYNKCIDLIRKNRTINKYQSTLTEQDFCNDVIEEDLLSLLLDGVETLPEQYRKVITMTLDGENIAEIAKQLNVSIDAVKAYKRRGKELLRKSLKEFSFIISLFL